MSWIFGASDPDGLDPAAVLAAAGPNIGPFEPAIHPSPSGVAVLGAFRRPDAGPGLVWEGRYGIAVDGRVDAIGEIDLGSVEGAAAASAILDVLARRGPAGLDDLAADFAFARFDSREGSLLLSRDATGNRPLYWARRGNRSGFASDPRFLINLGLCDGDIDPRVCATSAAGLNSDPRQTGLRGVYRVLGGRWLELANSGRWSSGRWFRPEHDPVDREISTESIAEISATIRTAVRDRARDGHVGVFLSGGRDSGSIAMALGQEGISADCFTMSFDPQICPSETEEARSLAAHAGHRWHAVLQPPQVVDEDIQWLLNRTPLPLGYPFATSARANHGASVKAGVHVLMEGYGGELFVASPLATLDLLRAGKTVAATRAARAFDRRWVYPYAIQAKAAVRALLPPPISALRERRRPLPPWARVPPGHSQPGGISARTALDYRLQFLLWEGTNPGREDEDAISFPDGVRASYPFYDRRVIRAALRLPMTSLVPDPEPKWVLSEALLGDQSRSRVKGDQEEWFRAVARGAWDTHSHVFSARSLIASRGLVDPEGLRTPFARRWEILSSRLVFLESALQSNRYRPMNKEGPLD